MPFLVINGVTIPITDASAQRALTKRGARGRSSRGMMRDSRRDIKREWNLEACYNEMADTPDAPEALMGMLQGNNHLIGFSDGLNALGSGLNPLPGHSGVTLEPSGTNAFTSYEGRLTTGAADDALLLTYDSQLFEHDWTVGLWVDDGGVWKLYVRRSDDTAFVAGVQDNTVLSDGGTGDFYIKVVDGVTSLYRNTGSGTSTCDDLFLFPWYATDAMIAAWTAMTVPFGSFPALRMSGDIIQEDYAFVTAQVDNIAFTQKPSNQDGFSWVNNQKRLRFKLVEVPDALARDQSFIDPVPEVFSNTLSTDFDGINDRATAGDVTSFDFLGGESRSFGGWFKTSVTGSLQFIMNKDNILAGTHFWTLYLDSTNNVVAELRRNPISPPQTNFVKIVSSSSSLRDGTWHHVAVAYDNVAITLALYIDGVLDGSAVFTKNIDSVLNTSNAGSFEIANKGTNNETETPLNFYEGLLDELFVYSGILSAPDVTAIYNSGAAIDLNTLSLSATLLGWWRMGDGDTFPTLTDNAATPTKDLTMKNMVVGDFVTDVPT